MGCWNKTCGLSNLHITAGTPVYVFVLEETRDRSNCYSTSLFSPLLLPFESVYNDYGGGENSSGPALNLIMDSIKKDLVEIPLGENKYHDIEVSKDKFNEELFFKAIHENRLAIQGYRQTPINLSFTMFRKDIVDAILENREIEEYVGNGKGTCGYNNSYIRYKFKDIVSDLHPLIEEAMKKLEAAETDSAKSYMILDGLDAVIHHNRDNRAGKWLRNDSYRYSRIVDIKRVVGKAFEVGTLKAIITLEEILTEHLKALFIDGFMHAARKTWIPGGHEGSQNFSGSALRLLSSATLQVLDREKAKWVEEMGEDESEYIEE